MSRFGNARHCRRAAGETARSGLTGRFWPQFTLTRVDGGRFNEKMNWNGRNVSSWDGTIEPQVPGSGKLSLRLVNFASVMPTGRIMNRIQWAAGAMFVLFATPSPAAEYLYMAESPGQCALESTPAQYSIYIHSGDYTDVSGVSFRLECERFGPSQVSSVTTPPGVTIVSGSLFAGIVLAFDTPRALSHDAVLTVQVSGQEVYGAAWTRDVELQRGAVPVSLADFRTEGWPFDCIGTFAHWELPDTLSVPVGEDDAFLFRAVVSTASYPPNATVTIDDPAGWVIADFSDDVFAACGYCPWDWTMVTVPTHVPSGVADGTLHEITLVMSSFGGPVDERTVVLRAAKPVATEKKTIGGVKALYR